jgi:hypothetical protein
MKFLTLQFALILLPFISNSQSYFDQVNSFLTKEVVFGLINYGDLKENPEQLDDLIRQIASHDLRDSSQDYKTAFYINAYNLLVIKQISDNYPIKKPLDVLGFFKVNKFMVAEEQLTLDEIEFNKLIEPTKDARIHFALGCGARSCPFLYNTAYTPKYIQEQLDLRARLIIEKPSYVLVNEKTKTVTLNKIFDWYGDQFAFSAGSLIKFVNKYRFYSVPEDYQVKFQEYDWSLNDNH